MIFSVTDPYHVKRFRIYSLRIQKRNMTIFHGYAKEELNLDF
jgi:hypothetical protein